MSEGLRCIRLKSHRFQQYYVQMGITAFYDTIVRWARRDAGEDTERGRDSTNRRATWSELPCKDQLAVLMFTRFCFAAASTGSQSYIFRQLRSFRSSDGSTSSEGTVAIQMFMLSAILTGSQFCSAVPWGCVADSGSFGRKFVILVGLFASAVSTIASGFATSFAALIFWRMFSGVMNGSLAAMRTMIADISSERRHQTRAFLLLPMMFNLGMVVGPLLSGFLADSIQIASHADHETAGYDTKTRYPYAVPACTSGGLLICAACLVVLKLQDKYQYPLITTWPPVRLPKFLTDMMPRTTRKDPDGTRRSFELQHLVSESEGGLGAPPTKPVNDLRLSRICTSNLAATLLARGLNGMHLGTFNALWLVFISMSGQSGNDGLRQGLELSPANVGIALSVRGAIGIILQPILFPYIRRYCSTTSAYRIASIVSVAVYLCTPLLGYLPETLSISSYCALWGSVVSVMVAQGLARAVLLPSINILTNNACPHPSLLGRTHSLGSMTSTGARTLAPLLGSEIYALGLKVGKGGLGFYFAAAVALCSSIAGLFIYEGSGHEILLDDE